MSQHDYAITSSDANTGPTMRAAINAALQALASNNEGATEPPVKYPNMIWPDTTYDILKIRNKSNTDWISLCSLSSLWWTPEQAAVIRVDASTFTVSGNKTSVYRKSRALYLDQTSPSYGFVSSSAYSSGTGLTTVIVVCAVVDAGFTGVRYGQEVFSSPLNEINRYAEDTGSANAYAVSIIPVLTANLAGLAIYFKALSTNTGASTLNGVSILKTDGSALSPGDIAAGQVAKVIYDGTYFILLSPSANALNVQLAKNYGISAAVSSGAIVITRIGDNGSALSSSNIAKILFRKYSGTDSTPLIISYTGSPGLTIPSGATLGFTANETGRIYVYEGTDGTHSYMGVARTSFVPEDAIYTSGLLDASSNSNSVLYSSTALTGVWRCAGYIEVTMSASLGSWASVSKIQIMRPGVHRSGDRIQRPVYGTSTGASGSGNFPNDGSIPQIGEGNLAFSISITPTSAINKLLIRTLCHLTGNGSNDGGLALFQTGTSNALATSGNASGSVLASSNSYPFVIDYEMLAGSTSTLTFQARYGLASGTMQLNTQSSNGYGASHYSFISVEEIFA